jgi:uncharacterized protein with PIN domain
VTTQPASSPSYPKATVRFYVDADMLGLAKVLAGLRADVTYPGDPGGVVRKHERPPATVTSVATLDRDWIPRLTGEDLVIITRDRHIRTRPA